MSTNILLNPNLYIFKREHHPKLNNQYYFTLDNVYDDSESKPKYDFSQDRTSEYIERYKDSGWERVSDGTDRILGTLIHIDKSHDFYINSEHIEEYSTITRDKKHESETSALANPNTNAKLRSSCIYIMQTGENIYKILNVLENMKLMEENVHYMVSSTISTPIPSSVTLEFLVPSNSIQTTPIILKIKNSNNSNGVSDIVYHSNVHMIHNNKVEKIYNTINKSYIIIDSPTLDKCYYCYYTTYDNIRSTDNPAMNKSFTKAKYKETLYKDVLINHNNDMYTQRIPIYQMVDASDQILFAYKLMLVEIPPGYEIETSPIIDEVYKYYYYDADGTLKDGNCKFSHITYFEIYDPKDMTKILKYSPPYYSMKIPYSENTGQANYHYVSVLFKQLKSKKGGKRKKTTKERGYRKKTTKERGQRKKTRRHCERARIYPVFQ